MLQAILSAQKMGLEGEIKIPGYKDCVLLTDGANMTAAQLTRLRRQFLAYTKLHPTNDISKIGSLFVQFLSTSLRWNVQDDALLMWTGKSEDRWFIHMYTCLAPFIWKCLSGYGFNVIIDSVFFLNI